MSRHTKGIAAVALGAASLLVACQGTPMANLTQLTEARRLAATELVQFIKMVDAGNRAVMAETDEASAAFAREAEEAMAAVSQGRDTLATTLQSLGYTEETQGLGEFGRRFDEYRALDRSVLDLAVQNTNLKAQRLSFGAGLEAADALQEALRTVGASEATPQGLRISLLVAQTIAAIREVQVLQAPHIAEADDETMTRLEKRAGDAEKVARRALEALAPLVKPAARPQLARAVEQFDGFTRIHAEVVSLSRRNSNVQSLALSLGKKRALAARCEESLFALEAALAGRGFVGTR